MSGENIRFENEKLIVPANPIIPFIEGDGVGPDVSRTMQKVLDAAIQKAYNGVKKIIWREIFAGDKSHQKNGEWLPEETKKAMKKYLVSIKGPLTTPIGSGIRSLNVTLRQDLDLYACVRPVRYFTGVPNPMKEPEKLNVVIFRENTEDVYAGIEWEEGSADVKKVINFLNGEMGKSIREDSGIGVKPISKIGTERIVRAAIKYAISRGKKSITIVHKGNIMKFTEGAFRKWGYELARKEFESDICTEDDFREDKIIIKDRIADAMFQQLLLRPDEYDVIATSNLNGDYISDACAAQVGGLGLAPGANINYETGVALFEATHGTAPRYAGQDKVNPSSMILSGVMMLEYIGWDEAADLIAKAFEKTIKQKKVTYDLERQMDSGILLKCSEFGQAIIDNM